MLSTAAFNALLKTMEEPPEPRHLYLGHHGGPQGARDDPVSRCQRYDFTRIAPQDIEGRSAVCGRAGENRIDAGMPPG